MSFIECYEPEYVRNFMTQYPDSPLYIRKVWKNEIRQSLMLTEPESCEAVLNDAGAFDLQLTYRPAEDNAAELSARDAIVNRVILSTLTLPDLPRSFHCTPSGFCSPAPAKCRAETEIFLPA